jgi:esterase/lipase
MKKEAILFIHGFMGNPNEFDILKDNFNNLGYETFSFVLSGHSGGKINHVKRKDWENDCVKSINLILSKGYKEIIIVSHSMGAVLASMMALKYKDKIKKLIYLSPAFEYLRMKNRKLLIFPSIKQIIKIAKDKENKERSSQVFRLTISSIREFCLLIKEHGYDVLKVKFPILLIHGENDNVIPLKQVKEVYDKIDYKNKIFILLENESHWFLSHKVDDFIYQEINKFCQNKK